MLSNMSKVVSDMQDNISKIQNTVNNMAHHMSVSGGYKVTTVVAAVKAKATRDCAVLAIRSCMTSLYSIQHITDVHI